MSSTGDDGDEPSECPLCLEELDATDRNFKPCKCGYQVCLWCWHSINEKLNGKCPACRAEYRNENIQFVAPDEDALQKHEKKKKAVSVSHQHRSDAKASAASNNASASSSTFSSSTSSGATSAAGFSGGASGSVSGSGSFSGAGASAGSVLGPGRKFEDLSEVRVLQRNLLYVVGLPLSAAREEVLRKKEYFGRFGKIVKIAVNRKQIHTVSNVASYSAYVTFKRAIDAKVFKKP